MFLLKPLISSRFGRSKRYNIREPQNIEYNLLLVWTIEKVENSYDETEQM